MEFSIVDYGMGNIGSIKNMMKYLGYRCNVVSTAKEILNAEHIILPGVGHFAKAMENIKKMDIDKALDYVVNEKKSSLLGICLGMQLLLEYSEEGNTDGLGFIRGEVKKFKNIDLNIPHMGWNTIKVNNSFEGKKLFEENDADARFYFVHSYYAKCYSSENVMAITEYGHRFDSVIYRENIMGVQFHPEKSHLYGMQFFRKYMEKITCTTTE